MGKDRAIKIIANLIAGMAAHRILFKYTNRPESINHIESEIENYRGTISDYLTEFNWNSYDKERIKREAKRNLRKELKETHFKDVSFSSNEISKMLNETIQKFFN